MTRTSQHGKSIRRVLEWLLNRDLTDAEMAKALGMSAANYSRRKDQDNFPTFEELTLFGEHFGISPLALQISFGFVPRIGICLLDEKAMDRYVEQGSGDTPQPPCRGARGRTARRRGLSRSANKTAARIAPEGRSWLGWGDYSRPVRRCSLALAASLSGQPAIQQRGPS
jgi:hypothetical protein